jgi:hypothetical protein
MPRRSTRTQQIGSEALTVAIDDGIVTAPVAAGDGPLQKKKGRPPKAKAVVDVVHTDDNSKSDISKAPATKCSPLQKVALLH